MELEIVTAQEELLLGGLNQRQKDAVKTAEGAVLVIAGAGSGKTAVLSRRVAYLIAQGVIPGNILCLTFTNKAAHEMRSRVHSILNSAGINLPFIPVWMDDYTQNPLLCTFHSLGVKLLREFGSYIDLKKDFSIIDDDDQKKLIKEILKERNISESTLQPRLASYFISQCKQELLSSSESRKLEKEFLPVFHQIYADYEKKLFLNQTVDFDDLLMLPYKIIDSHEEVRLSLQDRWTHIMVDEFQDTNKAQFEMIKLLCPPEILTQ